MNGTNERWKGTILCRQPFETAIDKFTLLHVCNKYCKMLELEPFIASHDSLE